MGLLANPTIPDEDCTLATCSLLQAHYQYLPSLAGNALYVAIFSILLLSQIFLGFKSKAWGFMIGMVAGIILEIVGYVGRIQMHSNPFIDKGFLSSLVTLTIAPAFLSASIYLCLARIVVTYGETISRIKPRTYTILFMSCDFVSLLLQAAGGAIAASSDTVKSTDLGVNIMIAGLSFQVVSLVLFIGLCCDFAWSVRKAPKRSLNQSSGALRESKKFKAFLICLGIATIAVFIRSVFRVAELSDGFHGKLANQEVTFMILEGAMIIIAVSAVTIMHPYFAFGGAWGEAAWSLRGKKGVEAGFGGKGSRESVESVEMK
ncbi:hypothetical protein EG328_009378 [Venturia inaequalis]|uniref:RTA1-domain-containing protein n=1 Tax=Venturia inaequalis TaxID=5025 RepID=A0A8H3U8S0_VENIN|nr:hypothetical protein EG328_009378 [Venturia inaequalis]RDI77210.1 hypothetical protein Vi05172_g12777 [Venturia inaequalis]